MDLKYQLRKLQITQQTSVCWLNTGLQGHYYDSDGLHSSLAIRLKPAHWTQINLPGFSLDSKYSDWPICVRTIVTALASDHNYSYPWHHLHAVEQDFRALLHLYNKMPGWLRWEGTSGGDLVQRGSLEPALHKPECIHYGYPSRTPSILPHRTWQMYKMTMKYNKNKERFQQEWKCLNQHHVILQ